ncbi:metallophosphoesterase family protein [Candidatus Saccharibacteria bacterium]|nr:MAG: metallophosphoesterase family protein [Candidatus Saccharibacteria bacterium]
MFLVTALVVGILPAIISSAQAASPDSLYTYDFRSVTGTTQNLATANSSVNLSFVGSWTSDNSGTNFTGNTTNTQSSSYAKPASGDTINVSSNQAVGASALFVYRDTCQPDSENISQIGIFAAGTSQVKLQLSKCVSSKTYPECRIAGALTPTGTLAVRGSQALVDGSTYRLTCVKGADVGASAPFTMQTVLVDTINGNQTTTNTFNIPDTGLIRSTNYLTAGNKYPLPTQTKNTDQFIGKLVKLSYCKSVDALAVTNCLDQEVAVDSTPPPAPTADEIKYAFGNTADSVVFSWRGGDETIYYGLDTNYGSAVTAVNSAITPVDIAGPFREAVLSGLSTGTTYHYKIGVDGVDHTFSTVPSDTDSFKVVSVGDTIASTCRSYQAQLNQLVLDQNANFMIHGGDIAIANECGVPAVHQYYKDIEPFSNKAAFMPVWGNHEYGKPTANAPTGTPRDTLANYKGRSFIPNAQTVPSDTATNTSNPGCGSELGSTVNTCQGKDWGWFKAGKVLFISYPSTWDGAIADWQIKAGSLMAQAQTDDAIDYIVTYGHHPVLSSTGWTAPAGYNTAFSTLGDLYGSGSVTGGKYVLNIAQHRHNMETIDSFHGVSHVVNGGGGQGLINFQTPVAGSVFRAKHLGFSTLDYNATTRSLNYSIICGPSISSETYTCAPSSTIYSRTFDNNYVTP